MLGGTVFLGRHLVSAALEAGHNVTLFNRGETNPDLFPELPVLHGDRHQDLSQLKEGTWDAVIDTSGYTPEVVKRSASLLSSRANHYTFISTISVYKNPSQADLDEQAATAQLPSGHDPDQVTGESYGPLKALCERAVEASFSGSVLIVRPGLIVGPHDPTDRFTYWPRRFARGGQVLAPGKPERPVQLIDVRDLAQWIVEQVAEGTEGTFNATGPKKKLSMEDMLETCRRASDNDSEMIWVDDKFLLETGVKPFSELPLWLPEHGNGLLQVNIERALDAGLSFRSLLETAKDTLAWDQEIGGPIGRGPAIGPARELALLEAYQAKGEPAD
jgi:2'-hydroxyisoflavone reductase